MYLKEGFIFREILTQSPLKLENGQELMGVMTKVDRENRHHELCYKASLVPVLF